MQLSKFIIKNKMHIRIYGLVVLGLFIMFYLCGCSPSSKSEDDIFSDLINDSRFFPYYNETTPTDYKIIKRQTNAKEKQDIVYIGVEGNNDNIKYYILYQMIYNLYNEGWILDDIKEYNKNEWTVVPTKGVNDTLVQESLREFIQLNDNDKILISEHTTNLQEKVDLVSLSVEKNHLYGTEIINYNWIWTFDSDGIYEYVASESLEEVERNLVLNNSIVGAKWINEPQTRGSNIWGPYSYDVEVMELNDNIIKCNVVQNDFDALFVDEPLRSMTLETENYIYNSGLGRWGIELGNIDDQNPDINWIFYFDLDKPEYASVLDH